MTNDILLSKIVSSPTDTTWSQAYSTLNLYVVLSIKSQDLQENIVTSGKELLERLQREYFSLDDKSLKNIKKSVESAIGTHDENKSISIVLATINKNVLYIIIAYAGLVVIKRGEKIGEIARGENKEIVAFSGQIREGDVIILETYDFSQKIPIEKFSEILDALSVSEISENLAPVIHDHSQGTEAAIILQYKSIDSIDSEEKTSEYKSQGSQELDETEESQSVDNGKGGIALLDRLKALDIKSLFLSFGRKKLIIISIILLIILFSLSIIFEKSRQENARREQIFSEILSPIQKKSDEADALISLNKALALSEFENIKTTLENQRRSFKEGTSQRKKIDEFIGKVEGKIGELGEGSAISNQKIIFEKVHFVSFRDGKLVAANKDGKIFLLSAAGEVEEESDSENKNVQAITSDDNYVFILGDEGITRTIKSSGKTTSIVKSPDATISLDPFGSNLYGLNTSDKTVDKYSGSSFARSDYLTQGLILKNPISMSIDGSVWIIDDGKVRKFTRGKEDNFSLPEVGAEISSNSQIFTDIDYTNIYILDKKTARIMSVSKNGELENQYAWSSLSNATSFAVDEKGKKIYVVIDNKLHSFDL